MASQFEKLTEQEKRAQTDLETIEKHILKARRELEADESTALIEDREPNPKLKKKLSDFESAALDLRRKMTAITRTLTELREVEDRERGQAARDAIEAFRKKSAPQLTRLYNALFLVRNETQKFVELMESESINIPSLHDFLFPPADATNSLADMGLRFRKLEMLNAAFNWITEDVRNSRTGPQQPKAPKEMR